LTSEFRIAVLIAMAAALDSEGQVPLSVIYAETSEVAGEHATLEWLHDGRKTALAPGFAASADAAVSFDGRRVLFTGKRKVGDSWQVFEVTLSGGEPRRITACAEDAVAPRYLPDDRIVYARRTPRGLAIESLPLAGGAPARLSFAPGDHVPVDVLREGRILFEKAGEVFALYSDGSGVESYRCDHGPIRGGARQVSSGDIVFATAGKLARFTSARATEVAIPVPAGEFAGAVAEISPAEWLVSYRPPGQERFGLYRWSPGRGAPRKVVAVAGAHALSPVLVRPRAVPHRHPSALGDREGANLLCLGVYASKERIPPGSAAAVRVWGLDAGGRPVALGEAPVESDGSFFVQTPSDAAIRFELLDRVGKTVAAGKSWFWARRGEQRVCVGCHAGPERAPDNLVPAVLKHTTDPVRIKVNP
jgi:hypothetical protein